MQARLDSAGITVRGQQLRIVVEHSPQRKLEYGQYARALEELHGEPDLVGKWVEDGRALRVYAAASWQELGRPTSSGWTWELAAFVDANLALPSFLGGSGKGEEVEPTAADDDKDM